MTALLMRWSRRVFEDPLEHRRRRANAVEVDDIERDSVQCALCSVPQIGQRFRHFWITTCSDDEVVIGRGSGRVFENL